MRCQILNGRHIAVPPDPGNAANILTKQKLFSSFKYSSAHEDYTAEKPIQFIKHL
jgi:hypothetical protein